MPGGFRGATHGWSVDIGASEPARHRVVPHVRVELGQKPQWIDLRPVPTATLVAPVPVPRSPAEAVPPEGVDLARPGLAQGHAEIGHRQHVLLEPVAPVEIWLRHWVPLDGDLP